jgi:hypothetical protein
VHARVALVIQHATRMRHIVLSSVASLAPPHFLTLPHIRYDFREVEGGGGEVTVHKTCDLIFSTIFTILI